MRRTAGSAAEVYGIITIPMARWLKIPGSKWRCAVLDRGGRYYGHIKWHEQDHTWYYLDASGAAVTGWKEIDGSGTISRKIMLWLRKKRSEAIM